MLRVTDLHCNYGPARVLTGVSLHVDDGEVLCMLGRNGMGKTTLVRAISGIDPPQVVSGEVTYREQSLAGEDSFRIARAGLGYVPQGRHVFGSLTVVENLEVIARPPADGGGGGAGRGGRQAWTLDRVFEFFPRLGERRTSFARNLSGGEQQMLAIARALMTNPTLLVMDEPSEGLAPIVLGAIRDRLLELKGPDLSILLVEQNLGLALSLADRVVILGVRGTIDWEGTPSQLRGDEDLKRSLLGV